FRAGSSKTTNPTTQGANLRGVSGSGASRASVLFDGLSINDAFGGWTYWSRVPRIAVDRAELLRGGASSVYGSGGLSGAVNLVPARAEDGETVLRLEGSGGTQETADGGLFLAHSRDKWSFDLALDAFTTGGYVPVPEDERGVVDTRANSEHGNIIAGIERRFAIGRIFARGSIFDEDRDNGTSLTNNATYFRQLAAGGDVDHKTLGRFEVRTFLQTQVYDQTFTAVSLDRNTETLTRVQRVPSQAWGASLFWTRAFGDHAIASSVEYRDVRGFSDELGFSSLIATSASGAGGHEQTVAVFAQDFWRVTGKLNLSFGGRFDHWRNIDAHSATRVFATNALTSTVFPDRGASSFSPRVGVVYDAFENVSLYGSYSRSFRAPTLNELYRGFRVGNVVTLANENLSAERANTFEGGIRLTALKRRLTIRTNAFVTIVEDPVVSITLSSSPALITRRRENVGETRSSGVEVDAEFTPITSMTLSGTYLFVDARVTDFPGNESLVGNRLPQVPQQQFNFQFRYRPDERWTFGVQTRASSDRFEDDANTLLLGGYFTADATAAFRATKQIEVFTAAENVFNSRYDIGLTPNRTVAAPAFVRVGLRFNLSKR
ncbi:MAG TPA: TonB-dependent receptor, partial [Pyrinomonadaceae bacterium]|nr:TonB-dependent receptor [Pyrinomonadaceae bacterium]